MRKNRVCLQMKPAPFFLSDGREILRSLGWCRLINFSGGNLVGVSVGASHGRAWDATLTEMEAADVKFYAAGTWESEKYPVEPHPGIFSELGIKPEIWAEIRGGAS